MKKVKLGFLFIAMAAGLAGAFATTTHGNGGARLSNPNWQTTDASGNVIPTSMGGVYDANRTVAQAKADYGCTGTSTDCAVTVTAQNGAKTPSPTFILHN